MARSLLVAVLCAPLMLAGLAVAQTGSPGSPAPQPNSEMVRDFARVDAAAREYIEKSGLPGAALMVIEGTRITHEKYYGSYDEQTVVSLASASKWLSGATMVALQDEGKLDLDDAVSKYVKEFGADPKASRAGITLRQCFNHTSGLPGDSLDVEGPRLTLEEAAAKIAGMRMRAEPGAQFAYGGVSMRLAGRCAEVAAEKSWREIFEEQIAAPLKLTSTKYGRLGLGKNPNLAGGASSTLRDYGRFMMMLVNGGELDGVRVLSEEGVRELLRDATGGVEIARASVGRRANGGKSSYGVGCWVDRKNAEGETITASSPGAFGFLPALNTERDIAVIWMIEDRARERNSRDDLPDMKKLLTETLMNE